MSKEHRSAGKVADAVWKSGALIVASVVLALLLAEAFFRFYSPLPSSLAVAKRSKHWDSDIGYVFEPGSRFGFWKWGPRGGKIFDSTQVINAWGFADQPVPETLPQDGLRIMILGDSFAEALQVEMDQKTGVLLENTLREQLQIPVKVVTLGRSGTGQSIQYSYWRKYRDAVRPQILVLMIIPNDIRDNHPELSSRYGGTNPLHPPRPYFMVSDKAEDGLLEIPLASVYREHSAAMLPIPRPKGELLRQHSALVHFLVKQFGTDTMKYGLHRVYKGRHVDFAMFEHDDEAVPSNAREITRRVLARFARECRERNIRLLLMTAKGPENHRRPEKSITAKLDRWVAGWAEEMQVDMLSVHRESVERDRPYKEMHWEYDAHWDPRGHRFASKLLTEYVLALAESDRLPRIPPPGSAGGTDERRLAKDP